MVLNDLIHILKKYRAPNAQQNMSTHGVCLNLMLGVQNNNRDEVHLRINIQNSTKLSLKTFYFPSMKNIIFEVMHTILLTKKSPSSLALPLTFSQMTIKNLIESINLYGMSVDKFKRTLRLMLAEHFYLNEYFFVHK